MSKHSKLNPVSFILDIVFSPLLVLGVAYWYFQDFRKASFVSLVAVTGYNVLVLLIKFVMLIVSSMTFNIFGVIKRLFQIIITLIVIGFYWWIYTNTWGAIYTL